MAEEIITEIGPNHSIEITKNTKGYNWSIKVSSQDPDYVKMKIEELEVWCKKNYGEKE